MALELERFDDGQTPWIDWEKTTEEELNTVVFKQFDIFNVPFGGVDESKMPDVSVTYFKCNKSKTGYCAICLRRKPAEPIMYKLENTELGYRDTEEYTNPVDACIASCNKCRKHDVIAIYTFGEERRLSLSEVIEYLKKSGQ